MFGGMNIAGLKWGETTTIKERTINKTLTTLRTHPGHLRFICRVAQRLAVLCNKMMNRNLLCCCKFHRH